MGLQFRPEYNEIVRFFGTSGTQRAPYYAVIAALDQLEEKGQRWKPEFPAGGLKRKMKEAVEALKEWFDEFRAPTPTPDTLRTIGSSLLGSWIEMLSLVFPVPAGSWHAEVEGKLRKGNLKVPKYDPRQFAIGVSAHAALSHLPEWVEQIGPRSFHAVIEIGGEYTLSDIAQLAIKLNILRYGHLLRPGVHLCMSVACVLSRLLESARRTNFDIVDQVRCLSRIIAAKTTSLEPTISPTSMTDSQLELARLGLSMTKAALAKMGVDAEQAASTGGFVGLRARRVVKRILDEAEEELPESGVLAFGSAPHRVFKPKPSSTMVDRGRYKDSYVDHVGDPQGHAVPDVEGLPDPGDCVRK